MRILMVNKFLYPKGGSETYMFSLADYLERQGHQVEFFGMYDERNIRGTDKATMVGNMDFHRKSPGMLLYPFKIIFSLEAKNKIGRMLEKFKPDIVHLNNYNFQLTPSIIYEIKKHSIPMVQTLHDYVLICPSHALYNFTSGQICEKCKGHKYHHCITERCLHNSRFRGALGAAEGYVHHLLKTYDAVGAFLCPTRFMADKMAAFGVDKRRLVTLNNFISEKFVPDKNICKKDYVLYFGRLSREKGISTLIKAIKELPHIPFVFAGAGDLEKEITGLSNVRCLGFKKWDELKSIIQESLFTVCPSEWYENGGLSILESQALGTPAIGANIGGIPEHIRDGYSGLLFQPSNADDLIDKIETLYNNRGMLDKFSSRCREFAGGFSIERHYHGIMEIYRCTIERM